MPDFSTARQLLRSLKRASRYSQLQKAMVESWRLRNADRRLLPSFIIIGAQKAGTTSLYHYLQGHPQILAPSRKELFFFDGGRHQSQDVYIEKGLPWYRLHFPLTGKLPNQLLTYEATTSYLYSPVAAERIAETLPDVRLIAILRDPIKRAISHFQHNLRKGRETLSFSDAIRMEEERISDIAMATNTLPSGSRLFSYKARGRYFEQLVRYQSFLDKGHLLVLSSEQLFADPQGVANRIFRFLGLSECHHSRPTRQHNSAPNKISIDPDDISLLKEYFAKPNEDLFNLIGQRFAW